MMRHLSVVLFALVLAVQCWPGLAQDNTLYEHLEETFGLIKKIKTRPTRRHDDTVEVRLRFELMKIISVDEKSQVMTSVGFFVTEWNDENIAWIPSTFGGQKSLVLPPTTVWLPDIGIANSVTSFYQSTFTKDFRVRIMYDGNITWSFGGEITTVCTLDMTFYPFDLQQCSVLVENWAYDESEVQLRNARSEVDTESFESNGVWDIAETLANHTELSYDALGGEVRTQIHFTLFLKRKALFYVLNLIVPCVLIIVVALGVYWLPADSGEKVSLGVTVLLAFSVFQLVIADQTPVNSDFTPVLARMVISIMSLSSVSVLTSIWILNLHHNDSTHVVPGWVRTLFFRVMAPLLCMRTPPPNLLGQGHIKVTTETVTIPEAEVKVEVEAHPAMDKILENLNFITDRIREKDQQDDVKEEWRAVAKILDRFLFWLSLLVIVVILAILITRQDPNH